MTREIKFRAFAINRKEMVYSMTVAKGKIKRKRNCLYLEVYGHFIGVRPNTLGQYTGLKDKNGVEIYEGDKLSFTIFDYNDNDTQYEGFVVYSGSRFCLWNKPNEEYYGSDGGFDLDYVLHQDCEVEITGNIHQNPELL